MSDHFKLDHQRVQPQLKRVPLSRTFIEQHIVSLSQSPLVVDNERRIRKISNVKRLEQEFKIILKDTFQAQEISHLKGHEKCVATVIVLHKLQGLIQEDPLWKGIAKGMATVVAGTMIQRALTMAMLLLNDEARFQVLGWGTLFPSLNALHWRLAFSGATSVARTIYAAHLFDHARIYLPSTYEDAIKGIDLFMHLDHTDLALSVKTSGYGTEFLVLNCQLNGRKHLNWIAKELEHIRVGAVDISKRYDRKFHGLLVIVNCPENSETFFLREDDPIALHYAIKKVTAQAII